MDDFKIDARRWRFLDNPARYIERDTRGLQLAPLTRQFKTAKEILTRLADGRGVLLADDVGLGKTTVGALVAWVVACQDKRVRIYAPNEVLRRRWAEELERHVPLLDGLGASKDRIRQGNISDLKPGSIQVATHHELIRDDASDERRTRCDLMIIDEAHRAKGEGSAFNDALHKLGYLAKRKLILTATPFSIRLAELEQLLKFVGAKEIGAVKKYADALTRLYMVGEGHDVTAESMRLVRAAKAAIETLQPYLIRHGVDDLSKPERKHFGEICDTQWEIATPLASEDEIKLLLRMDRLLQLAPERRGKRRNDPRFHIGWQHVGTELDQVGERANEHADHAVSQHIGAAKKSLGVRRSSAHPKVAAVSKAILPLLETGEKVLVFCHHRATASELLGALEGSLKAESLARAGPPEEVWRAAWESTLIGESLRGDESLLMPIIDWLCSPGIRWQITEWLGKPKSNPLGLASQLAKTRPRGARAEVPTILDAARMLVTTLLDMQSTSTRAVLRNIAKREHTFGGKSSHFPGRLDDGLRVMGSWQHNAPGQPPSTLYTGKPDIVLALFNSPFGPDVLVTTDHLSEGVDLHRCCRHLIHYELDPSPVRTLQRNGRVRRVGSWAALTGKPICYAYPTFGGTRDEKAVAIMRQRINAFGLLLGGVPSLDDESGDSEQSFAEAVLGLASKQLASLNRHLTV
jgi:ERCC4-related helicase